MRLSEAIDEQIVCLKNAERFQEEEFFVLKDRCEFGLFILQSQLLDHLYETWAEFSEISFHSGALDEYFKKFYRKGIHKIVVQKSGENGGDLASHWDRLKPAKGLQRDLIAGVPSDIKPMKLQTLDGAGLDIWRDRYRPNLEDWLKLVAGHSSSCTSR